MSVYLSSPLYDYSFHKPGNSPSVIFPGDQKNPELPPRCHHPASLLLPMRRPKTSMFPWMIHSLSISNNSACGEKRSFDIKSWGKVSRNRTWYVCEAFCVPLPQSGVEKGDMSTNRERKWPSVSPRAHAGWVRWKFIVRGSPEWWVGRHLTYPAPGLQLRREWRVCVNLMEEKCGGKDGDVTVQGTRTTAVIGATARCHHADRLQVSKVAGRFHYGIILVKKCFDLSKVLRVVTFGGRSFSSTALLLCRLAKRC